MRKYIGLVFLVFLVSCKAKKAVVTSAKPTKEVTAEKIIASHYNLKNDFKTCLNFVKSSGTEKGILAA